MKQESCIDLKIYLQRMPLEDLTFDAGILWLNINITDSLFNNNH